MRKRDVDFLQAAIRHVLDRLVQSRWKRWREDARIPLEPAEWTSDDDFIEGAAIACSACDANSTLRRLRPGLSLDLGDFCIET